MTYSGTNAETYTGIDLSKHNSDVDFAKVKAAGVDFAMIRCGYRLMAQDFLWKILHLILTQLMLSRII